MNKSGNHSDERGHAGGQAGGGHERGRAGRYGRGPGQQKQLGAGRGRRSAARKDGRLPKNAPPVEVVISHVGGRGDGVGTALYTHNHLSREHMVFVPASLPGERVLAQPLSLNAQGIRARMIELIEPAKERRAPACAAFPACGGCQFQHWQEDAVSAWKQAQVEGFLERADIWPDEMRPLKAVPMHSRRRATFHLKRLAGGVVAGFNERQGTQIIAPEACVVLHPELLMLLGGLQAVAMREFPVGASIDAKVNRLDQGLCVLLHVTAGGADFAEMPALLAALGSWAGEAGLARLSLMPGDMTGSAMGGANLPARTTYGALSAIPLYAPAPPTLRFGTITVTPPPGAFLQASPEGEAALQAGVAEGVAGARSVVDLFAGCGTLSLPLVEQGVQIVAVEQDREALAALKDGADAAGRGGQVSGRLTDLANAPLTADELAGFDAVILDPPRSGANAQCAKLVRSQVPRIVMVSCKPASFARDAALLCDGGYGCDWVQVIDQFRMSNHVEMLAQFSRI